MTEQIKGFNKFYEEVIKYNREEDNPVFYDSEVTWKKLKSLFDRGLELTSKKRVYQLRDFIAHCGMFRNIQLEGIHGVKYA